MIFTNRPPNTVTTISEVINTFDQEYLMSKVLGFYPKLYERIKSPFRVDNTAKCYFEWYNGELKFVDWADGVNIGIIGITMRVYKVNLPKALDILYDFHYDNHSLIQQEKIHKSTKPTINKAKFHLSFTSREFTLVDIAYWRQYGITTQQLESDNIFSVKNYTKLLNVKKTINNNERQLSYAITYPSSNCKVVNPYWKDEKFVSSLNQNDLGLQGLVDNFSEDLLVITKAYKDSRVIRNLDYNCIFTPSETQIPNDEELLHEICKLYSNIIVLYDNDDTGYKFANKFKHTLQQFKSSLTVNTAFFNKSDGKDSSDVYKAKSKDYLQKQLQILLK
jgi:5S rRNA maturation endonuclease (ribonuclease M5)